MAFFDGGGAVRDEVKDILYVDDFPTGVFDAGIGQLNWRQTGGSALVVIDSVDNHFGINQIGSSATINTLARIHFSTADTTKTLKCNKDFDLTWIIRALNNTAMKIRPGLSSAITVADSQTEAYFEFDSAVSANWRAVSAEQPSSEKTITDIPVTINQWYKLRILKTASKVEFYIDGILKATHLVGIPSGLANSALFITNTEAVNKQLDFDFFKLLIKGMVR